MSSWVSGIGAITLFVEDLATTKAFYSQVFELPILFEDAESAAFSFGDTVVNLLKVSAAPELIAPALAAPADAGVRFQLSLAVHDVDVSCQTLRTRGVTLLNGPTDRPWGIRTASFRDPAGHIWEITGPPSNAARSQSAA